MGNNKSQGPSVAILELFKKVVAEVESVSASASGSREKIDKLADGLNKVAAAVQPFVGQMERMSQENANLRGVLNCVVFALGRATANGKADLRADMIIAANTIWAVGGASAEVHQGLKNILSQTESVGVNESPTMSGNAPAEFTKALAVLAIGERKRATA